MESPLTPAKRRLLGLLKREGPIAVKALAEAMETSEVAVRQHLAALAEAELVASRPAPRAGRGRPAVAWELTDAARPLFPDHHGELAVGLIEAIRSSVGEEGLARVVDARAEQQAQAYRLAVPGDGSLRQRLDRLAELRTAEGYMAEVQPAEDGGYLLIEHHCPICDAARACLGLCAAELQVFRRTLGPDVRVERTTHLLDGGVRCCYSVKNV